MFVTIRTYVLIMMFTCILTACNQVPRGSALQSEFLMDVTQNTSDITLINVGEKDISKILAWSSHGERHNGFPLGHVSEYTNTIHIGDSINIEIWDSSENSLILNPGQRHITIDNIQVNAEGEIHLPYIGPVKINGMSRISAQELLTEKLQVISENSEVHVIDVLNKQNFVSISAGVVNPGEYRLRKDPYRMMDLLSDSGSFIGEPSNLFVTLTRNGVVYTENLVDIQRKPELNIILLPKDQIYISEDQRFYIALGAVDKQNIFKFNVQNLTATTALAQIGGLDNRSANLGGILILRDYSSRVNGTSPMDGAPQNKVVFQINLTSAEGVFAANKFLIEHHDILYVTETPINSIEKVLPLFRFLGLN